MPGTAGLFREFVQYNYTILLQSMSSPISLQNAGPAVGYTEKNSSRSIVEKSKSQPISDCVRSKSSSPLPTLALVMGISPGSTLLCKFGRTGIPVPDDKLSGMVWDMGAPCELEAWLEGGRGVGMFVLPIP